jgi:hypothetical protein
VSLNSNLLSFYYYNLKISEPSFDYNWGKRGDGASTTCYCETKICRGSIEK